MLACLLYCISKPSKTIIGGDPIDINEYPGTVSLKLGRSFHFCGGTIIGRRWILTAAHCVEDKTSADVTFNVGSSIQDDPALVDYSVSNIVIHPEYSFPTNDIAILESTTDNIFIVGFAQVNTEVIPVGSSAHTIGWGHITPSGTTASQLQYISGAIENLLSCGTVIQSLYCFWSGPTSTVCRGDSGSGLYSDDNILIGVTSFTYVDENDECIIGGRDGFARSDYHTQFICDATNNEAVLSGSQCIQISLLNQPPSSPPVAPPSNTTIETWIYVLIGIGVCIAIVLGYFICKKCFNYSLS